MSNRNRLSAAAAAAAVMTLVGFAFSGSVAADSHDLKIVDFGYEPATLTVFVGEPVGWTNTASQNHTVTSDTGSELDSGELGPAEGFGHVFEQPGTYTYHCEIHPDRMKGTIIVKAAPATPKPSGSPEPTPPSGTLPPDFSPFPSVGPDETPTPEPTVTPTVAATPIPTDATGGGTAGSTLLLIAVGAGIVGVATALLLRRRRAKH